MTFWETQKEILNCISIQQENNKEIRKVWKTKKGEDILVSSKIFR